MDKLQIFQNSEFGQIRTQIINDKIYFVANDVAKSLGYSKPRNAISFHCKGALKQGVLMENDKWKGECHNERRKIRIQQL